MPTVRTLRILERSLLGTGIALCVVFVALRAHGSLASDSDLERFARARNAIAKEPQETNSDSQAIDTSLWSEGRIEAYRESLGEDVDLPMAVLEIPAIGLEVPVLEGTDDLILNRAVGHISGTARPGENGNVAIAGHRDGFFRGLKDLELGARLVLTSLDDRQVFTVQSLTVVSPGDVHVLDPTPTPTLTLVTCYPFYFVGKAPQRFIVRAVEGAANGTIRDLSGARHLGDDDTISGLTHPQTM
jgi:sortase A